MNGCVLYLWSHDGGYGPFLNMRLENMSLAVTRSKEMIIKLPENESIIGTLIKMKSNQCRATILLMGL